MCLLIFAHRTSNEFPLVIAANRDEFHARSTAVSHYWPSYPDLMAGQDLEQGGTWMGVTRSGRFSAITNFRDPNRSASAPKSRGELPLNFLISDLSPRAYMSLLEDQGQNYAGFNLLAAAGDEMWYYDNSSGNSPVSLSPGIYGLSNASLDTPWPKVVKGKQRLENLLNLGDFGHAELAEVVSDQALADPASLNIAGAEPGTASSMEHLLSAQFIVTEAYGTRSTTSLWTDRTGRAHWRELSFDARGKLWSTCEEVVEPE